VRQRAGRSAYGSAHSGRRGLISKLGRTLSPQRERRQSHSASRDRKSPKPADRVGDFDSVYLSLGSNGHGRIQPGRVQIQLKMNGRSYGREIICRQDKQTPRRKVPRNAGSLTVSDIGDLPIKPNGST
jgi:hypothetical protein